MSLTFGCIDPNACQCRPEGGPAACAVGDAENPHCVYATCNGRNEDEACALPGGGEGVCNKLLKALIPHDAFYISPYGQDGSIEPKDVSSADPRINASKG